MARSLLYLICAWPKRGYLGLGVGASILGLQVGKKDIEELRGHTR